MSSGRQRLQGSISGKVLNKKKKPIRKAKLHLKGTPFHTETDDKGKFHFPKTDFGSYSIEASARNYKPTEQIIRIDKRRPTDAEFILSKIFFYRILGRAWKIIVGAGVIVALILGSVQLQKETQPARPVAIKEDDTGKLRPIVPPIRTANENSGTPLSALPIIDESVVQENFPKISGFLFTRRDEEMVMIGTGQNMAGYSSGQLRRGMEFDLSEKCAGKGAKIKFAGTKDRIYVSLAFRDLETGHVVGEIDFNKWKVYTEERLKYRDDDERLEVRDKRGYIICAVKMEKRHDYELFSINGYFTTPSNVTILNLTSPPHILLDTCISKDSKRWKERAEKLIWNIKSIFPDDPTPP